MSPHFKLFGRENCHLCHDMHEDLRVWQTKLNFTFESIDIDEDDTLQAQFGLMIPVLTNQANDVVCFGRLDATLLQQQF